ncbi:putative ubiquitin-like-specific protease 2B [Dorcoceras hygrometricum]|uniref:Putative ubiquitin-like-specific protease 2B n=1 Tax=Dorcoceras hygrometricum TaxID=472368 RepID=A0A2Z7B6N7_9LAMI|nr:putative ubiquitin-like-specific protease 2B [Dorcoceras hygrometricum]
MSFYEESAFLPVTAGSGWRIVLEIVYSCLVSAALRLFAASGSFQQPEVHRSSQSQFLGPQQAHVQSAERFCCLSKGEGEVLRGVSRSSSEAGSGRPRGDYGRHCMRQAAAGWDGLSIPDSLLHICENDDEVPDGDV